MVRTDLATATLQVMETIQDGNEYTLNMISEKTSLNFRTVQKSLRLIEEFQKGFELKKLNIVHLKNATRIQMTPKSGLTSMPINVQKMLIRTSYYPTPSREEEVLVYLSQKGAIDVKSGIGMESSKILEELVNAEHIIKKGKKFYLSDMGVITAKGAVSLYPELLE